MVFNASTNVIIFTTHICLEAPFRLRDLQNVRFWNRSIRHTLINRVLVFGLYTGVFAFYLWDLLPAVYLYEPHLFDNTYSNLNPTVTELAEGMLYPIEGNHNKQVALPKHINDVPAFMHALYSAWEKTATNR